MTEENTPFWRDQRVLRVVSQVLVLSLLILLFGILGTNLVKNFQQLGLNFGFEFLTRAAGFDLGNTLIPFARSDSYYRALLTGLLNSLIVAAIGIILATLWGVAMGVGRLSTNLLVRYLSGVYVETFRNTPLLLQLFFWYFAVFLKLPKVNQVSPLFGTIFLSNRGLDLPWPAGSLKTLVVVMILALGLGWVVVRSPPGKVLLALALGGILAIVFGLDWQYPQFSPESETITGGLNLSPEFATLLIGLTFYTAAFIAEVVRSGIQSVPKGQVEAAQALGLKTSLVLRLVVLPQAWRVMIPPLTSEFLNLIKNSTLAIAIGYADFYLIANTIANQTGRAVEMLLVVMAVYLSINLLVSRLMNWLNLAVQIPEK